MRERVREGELFCCHKNFPCAALHSRLQALSPAVAIKPERERESAFPLPITRHSHTHTHSSCAYSVNVAAMVVSLCLLPDELDEADGGCHCGCRHHYGKWNGYIANAPAHNKVGNKSNGLPALQGGEGNGKQRWEKKGEEKIKRGIGWTTMTKIKSKCHKIPQCCLPACCAPGAQWERGRVCSGWLRVAGGGGEKGLPACVGKQQMNYMQLIERKFAKYFHVSAPLVGSPRCVRVCVCVGDYGQIWWWICLKTYTAIAYTPRMHCNFSWLRHIFGAIEWKQIFDRLPLFTCLCHSPFLFLSLLLSLSLIYIACCWFSDSRNYLDCA